MSIRNPGLSRRSRRGFLTTVALGVLAAGGCGRAVPAGESQVWGRVLANGKPVAGGVVIFMPMEDRNVTWGAGTLDADGRFRLESARAEVPLLPGRYGVYLRGPVKVDREAGTVVADPDYPVSPRYLTPDTPMIQVDIKDEPTRFDFNLDD